MCLLLNSSTVSLLTLINKDDNKIDGSQTT